MALLLLRLPQTHSHLPVCLHIYTTEVVFWSGAWYVCLLIITVITGTLVSLKKGYMLVVAIRICFLFIYVSSTRFPELYCQN